MTTTTDTSIETFDNRVAFAEELIALAEKDERVVAVCNDSVGSSNLGGFRERFPDRLINVGIAEQNMVGVGAGLANAGLVPFVCGAGPFLTGRALEQVKADVAYSQLPVILCGMSPGVAYGELGPTHHSIEDFSWLRALPGLDIVIPADRSQTRTAIRQAAENPRPTYIRVGRFKVPDLAFETTTLERGRFQQLRPGTDVTIVAAGTMVPRALRAADSLESEGTSVRVLNAVYLSPFDAEAIAEAAHETRAIVTVEEANVAGGLGAAVAASVAGGPELVPVEILGFREFAPTGSVNFLLENAGLTAPDIRAAALRALSR
ncbi:transketolase C-terminal domain-containing protein [Microbacterium sp. X-17]|uniref:transketolase family protein n=1 Tax=Microbacterium sp. X-17 TaxID=3144404 RepID=UPI0031F4A64F